MWQSLHQVLPHLPLSSPSPEQQQFDRVQQAWPTIVGEKIAAYTRPISIQRDVLQVATANAVWAQNLMFQRRQWLKTLNRSLSLALVDLRFSTAQWHTPQSPDAVLTQSQQMWQQHPYRLADPLANPARDPRSSVTVPSADSNPTPCTIAFQRWATQMKAQAQQMRICPNCQSPATPGELDRWKVCGICMVQGASLDDRSDDF